MRQPLSLSLLSACECAYTRTQIETCAPAPYGHMDKVRVCQKKPRCVYVFSTTDIRFAYNNAHTHICCRNILKYNGNTDRYMDFYNDVDTKTPFLRNDLLCSWTWDSRVILVFQWMWIYSIHKINGIYEMWLQQWPILKWAQEGHIMIYTATLSTGKVKGSIDKKWFNPLAPLSLAD